MIKFPCTHCSRTLTVRKDKAGSKVRCPACSKVVKIPRAASKSKANDIIPEDADSGEDDFFDNDLDPFGDDTLSEPQPIPNYAAPEPPADFEIAEDTLIDAEDATPFGNITSYELELDSEPNSGRDHLTELPTQPLPKRKKKKKQRKRKFRSHPFSNPNFREPIPPVARRQEESLPRWGWSFFIACMSMVIVTHGNIFWLLTSGVSGGLCVRISIETDLPLPGRILLCSIITTGLWATVFGLMR